MRHVRMLGLCLVAVFAAVAVAATSASALEWGQCVVQPAHEGKYTDSNCTKKAKTIEVEGVKKFTGEFEFKKATEFTSVQKKFAGQNVGSGGVLATEFALCEGPESVEVVRQPRSKCIEGGGTIFVSSESLKVECESEANHGEVAGTKEVKNVSVVFHGCKVFGSAACSNGPEEGEIRVNVLKGKLGFIKKAAPKEVGVLLTPSVKKGEFAKFNCAGILSTVVGVGNEAEGAAYSPENTGGYDGIISPITPINTMTASFTQVYTINEATEENIPSHFEGQHIDLLEDYIFNAEEPNRSTFWQKAGEIITNENHQESGEKAEIKA